MQHITRRQDGEYVTTRMPSGIVETCWFPDSPAKPSRVIGRSVPRDLESFASEHITAHENQGE